jgi:ribosomal protein S18 acetylase RimI-like enzyme
MKIRRMVIQDYSRVKELWNACELSDEPEDQPKEISSFLDSPQSAGLVACEKRKIVGAVLCGSDGRYGYIHHLAVAESERKRGIGIQLVEACSKFLDRNHIIIMVRENNAAGNTFWSRLQFQNADGLQIKFLEMNNIPTPESTPPLQTTRIRHADALTAPLKENLL